MTGKKQIEIEIGSNLFNKVFLPYLTEQRPLQLFFGGSSSGKSRFLAQRTIVDMLNGKRNYLCVRNTANTLRTSVLMEVEKVISEWGLFNYFNTNKSSGIIECINGTSAVFRGLDDVERIKSITPKHGSLTDIWIEEATETAYYDFKHLTKRLRGLSDVPKRVTMSFNPILKTHWIYENFFGKWQDNDKKYVDDNILIMKTTYKDNAFLTQQDIKGIESEQDSYFYEVYTLGNWGILCDAIFNNWEEKSLSDKEYMFDQFDHGLDFGYSNDPTAYVKTYFHRATKTLYVCKEYANKEVTNSQIAKDIKLDVGGDTVVCDSAEPKSITELNTFGLAAIGASKGAGSILHGIQWLKGLKIVISPDCQNTINNFKQYHWLKDKQGNVLNKPVDRFNDFIDAIRYANEHHMLVQGNDDILTGDNSVSAQIDWI